MIETDTPISEEQVTKYLRDHKDFFANNMDLLSELSLPHESGQAVSLVERQVTVLRERNVDMRRRLSSLIDTARENDRLFEKTKRLVLALIEAQELGDAVDALYYSFDKEFGVEFTRLILFKAGSLPCGPARNETLTAARQSIGKRLKSTRTVSGGIEADEINYLFDNDAEKVKSAAMSVISYGELIGVLAIGNGDAEYYRSSMGTLFLSYITEVLNRVLPPLLVKQ